MECCILKYNRFLKSYNKKSEVKALDFFMGNPKK